MKFPRNARIFRGRLDAAPFATVFFLLAIFILLASLVYTPGVRLELPVADNLPGTDQSSVEVGIDSVGRLYFENELVDETKLTARLRQVAAASATPLTLVVQADKAVTYERLVRLTLIARNAKIYSVWLATLPRAVVPPPLVSKP